jgi:hypothetical protein
MARILFLTLFLSGVLILVNCQYLADQRMTSCRYHYMGNKTEALKRIEILYWRIYTTLNSTLHYNMSPFFRWREAVNKTCNNATAIKGLRSAAVNKIKNVCSIVNQLIPRTRTVINEGLMSFYNGYLGSTVAPITIAEKIFKEIESHQSSSVTPTYDANKTCVAPLLANYSQIYQSATDGLIMALRRSNEKVSFFYANATKQANDANWYFSNWNSTWTNCITQALNKANPISPDKTSDCLLAWVRIKLFV